MPREKSGNVAIWELDGPASLFILLVFLSTPKLQLDLCEKKKHIVRRNNILRRAGTDLESRVESGSSSGFNAVALSFVSF